MPVIRMQDGSEVWVDEDDRPAHLRRGRFDRKKKTGQTERQRLEDGLTRMAKAAKAFLLDDDADDIAVAAKMIDRATGKKLSE